MAIKVRKIIGTLLAILLVLVITVLCVFFFWLGPTVKMVAQKIGSKALGTPLTISELAIDPRHGTLHMTGFAIANHDEFGRSNAVSLASMDIALDATSIFAPTIVVHRVQIESPYFVYEQNAASDNITRFINNIQRFVGPESSDSGEESEAKSTDDSATKEVIVEQLEINDIQFHLANTDATNLDIDVGIEQLSVSMTNGTVTLKNFHISNPARLETPNLFTLDSIAIEVDPASIYSDTVSIRDVRITRPYAYLEHNPETDTVAELMKIVGRIADSQTNAAAEVTAEAPPEAEMEAAPPALPPVQLHNLLVDDIQIKLLDTTATNAPTEPRMLAGIGAISVKLVDGRIQIKGISVPNPAGYQATNLFQLANIDITIEPASIFSSQVDIQEIVIDSPQIALEQTKTSGNVSDIQWELMGFVPTGKEAGESPQPAASPAAAEQPEPIPLDEQPVILSSLVVTNFLVTVAAPYLTNAPSGWALDAEGLSHLRPMKTLAQALSGKESPEPVEEETQRADGPLKVITFRRLQLRPLDGTLDVENLTVANPRGFANKYLVALDQFRMEIVPDSIQTDTLVINDILIDRPHVSYERKITTDNIQTLQDEIAKVIQQRREEKRRLKDAAPPPEPATEQASNSKTEQKVIIKHLLVKDGLVKAKLSVAPSAPIPLLDIERTDMGSKEGGATLTGMATELGSLFYDAIIGCVSGATGLAGNALKGAGALTLGTLKKATGLDDEGAGATEADTAAIQTDEPDQAEPETGSSSKRTRRSMFRRRPGRIF